MLLIGYTPAGENWTIAHCLTRSGKTVGNKPFTTYKNGKVQEGLWVNHNVHIFGQNEIGKEINVDFNQNGNIISFEVNK